MTTRSSVDARHNAIASREIKQRALASVLRRVRVLECATRDAAAEAQRLSDALRIEQEREAQRDDVAA